MFSKRDLIRDASAATLGYMHGNIEGAAKWVRKAREWDSYINPRPAKRQKTLKGGSGIKKLTLMPPIPFRRTRRGRLAKKKRPTTRSQRKKRSSYTKRKPMSMKMRKQVKAIAQNVVNCSENYSLYEKNYGGNFDVANTGNGQYVTSSLSDNDVQNYPGKGLHMFTPRKFLDAASVLYNAKAMAQNHDIATNNFDVKDLKIDVLYASYKLTLKNITDVPFEVELYEFESKRNTFVDVQQYVSNSVAKTSWITTTPTLGAYGIKPTMFPSVKGSYNVKRNKFVLLPSQTKTFFYKWKGCLEMKKFLELQGSDYELSYMSPKVGRELMMICHPHLSLAYNNDTTSVGHQCFNVKGKSIVAEVNEVFKILQPDDTLDANEGQKRALFNNFDAVPQGGQVANAWENVKNFAFAPVANN